MDEKHGPAEFGAFTVAQSNVGNSTWSGNIFLDSTEVDLSAAAGGRPNRHD